MAKPKAKAKRKPAKKRSVKTPISLLGFGLVQRAAKALRKKNRKRREQLDQ